MARFSLALLALVFGVSAALADSNHAIRHESHDKMLRSRSAGNHTARTSANERDWKLSKRFDNARFTNYAAGMGACGKPNSDSDFIVALNSDQYGGGDHCFDMITISYNGKSTQAQITDECPGCPVNGLDLTPGLFQFFASLDDGVIYGSWSFGSGSSSSSSSSTWTPTSTSTHHSSSTSTWTPTTTSWSSTSTWSSSSSSSTWSSSSSTWSSSSVWSSSSATSSSSASSATPSATASVDVDSLIDILDYGVMQLGGLVAGAAQANLQTSDSS